VDDWIGSGGRIGPARHGWRRAAAADRSAVPQPSPSAPTAASRCGSRLRPLLQPTLLSCVLLLAGCLPKPTEPANPYLARTIAARNSGWAPPPRRACGSFSSALRETSR
jgi:hypothetical protein